MATLFFSDKRVTGSPAPPGHGVLRDRGDIGRAVGEGGDPGAGVQSHTGTLIVEAGRDQKSA
ncbi:MULTISPECIES: hypothetical protein [unclassified Streptomyces]|uniref:hypothetical protein n=1 Tax=unclassified Streptomyces TaxID=2593676 RepID=UPI002E1A40AE